MPVRHSLTRTRERSGHKSRVLAERSQNTSGLAAQPVTRRANDDTCIALARTSSSGATKNSTEFRCDHRNQSRRPESRTRLEPAAITPGIAVMASSFTKSRMNKMTCPNNHAPGSDPFGNRPPTRPGGHPYQRP
jgi:hypothetical protein